MTDNAKPAFAGTSAAPCSDFDRGVWFRAACTGLWYRCKESAGDIDAWKEDGVLHVIEDSPNAAGEVRRNAVTSNGLLAVSESGD